MVASGKPRHFPAAVQVLKLPVEASTRVMKNNRKQKRLDCLDEDNELFGIRGNRHGLLVQSLSVLDAHLLLANGLDDFDTVMGRKKTSRISLTSCKSGLDPDRIGWSTRWPSGSPRCERSSGDSFGVASQVVMQDLES